MRFLQKGPPRLPDTPVTRRLTRRLSREISGDENQTATAGAFASISAAGISASVCAPTDEDSLAAHSDSTAVDPEIRRRLHILEIMRRADENDPEYNPFQKFLRASKTYSRNPTTSTANLGVQIYLPTDHLLSKMLKLISKFIYE